MLVKLPKEVGRIMGTLQQSGFEAYVVGECISDSLAGKKAFRMGYLHQCQTCRHEETVSRCKGAEREV